MTAVDLEGVLPVTRKTVARFGLETRFDFLAGDVLKADIGSGYTVAIIGHLLHGLGVKDSQHLIRRVAAALAPVEQSPSLSIWSIKIALDRRTVSTSRSIC